MPTFHTPAIPDDPSIFNNTQEDDNGDYCNNCEVFNNAERVTCRRCGANLCEPVKDFDPLTMKRANVEEVFTMYRRLWGDLPAWMVRKGYDANPDILDRTQVST